MGMTVTIKKR